MNQTSSDGSTPETQIHVLAAALKEAGYEVRVGRRFHANRCTARGKGTGHGPRIEVARIARQYSHGFEALITGHEDTYLLVSLHWRREREAPQEPKPVTQGYDE